MRHRKKNNHLGRKAAHRKATLANLASSLILHKRINTTVAKAKALKVYVEPLITKSKLDSTHSRRVVFSYLGNKYAVSELFREVSQKVADRPGGYTRILKTGFRKGDGAEMCFIELVDYNLNMLKSAEETQQKRTRRSRARKKDEDEATTQTAEATKTQDEAAPEDVKVEDKVEETPEATKEEAKVDETQAAAEETKVEEKPESDKEEKKAAEKKEVKAEKTEEKAQEADDAEPKEDENKKSE